MIWLTWRQFRTQAAVVFGALVVVAVVLAVTGPSLVHLYDTYITTCKAAGDCASTQDPVLIADRGLQIGLTAVLLILPVLIGVFWGAPLIARELETGTYRLAWTQSVTRKRWLAVKLAAVGLASMAVAGLFSLMVTWWSSPIDRVNMNRFTPGMFGLRGVAPIGYAAFAFAFGVTAGVLMRRTLPAMATTLVAFVAARLAVTYWVRPHLIPPVHTDVAITPATGVGLSLSPSGLSVVGGPVSIPNAWVYSSAIVDKAGRAPTSQFLKTACPNLGSGIPGGLPPGAGVRVRVGAGGGPQGFEACTAKVAAKFHEVVTYQPASRYWAFQWYETAIFLALALLLAGLCFWWVRHRLS